MGRVTKRPAAEADLIDLWRYIAADNPDKADEVLLAIEQKCSMISDHPHLGRPRDELAPGLRSFPAGSHVLFYLPTESGIELVRILHGAQDLGRAFGRRRRR